MRTSSGDPYLSCHSIRAGSLGFGHAMPSKCRYEFFAVSLTSVSDHAWCPGVPSVVPPGGVEPPPLRHRRAATYPLVHGGGCLTETLRGTIAATERTVIAAVNASTRSSDNTATPQPTTLVTSRSAFDGIGLVPLLSLSIQSTVDNVSETSHHSLHSLARPSGRSYRDHAASPIRVRKSSVTRNARASGSSRSHVSAFLRMPSCSR